MAGYIGSKSSVTLVDGYTEAEADAEFVNDPNDVITVSGSNVGIGTSSGANLLNIHQSSASSNSYLHITHVDGGAAATDGLSIGLESDGVNAVIRNRENGYLRMYTNNAERMRIDSSGNLLVGTTTSPSSSDVKQVISSANGSFTQYSYNGGAGGVVGCADTGYLDFFTYTGNIGSETYSRRMSIDSSGNVLVGKTSVDFGTSGMQFLSSGLTQLTATGQPLYLNRLGSDGNIVDFRKDGTTHGAIGRGGSGFYISGIASSDFGVLFDGSGLISCTGTGVIRDNQYDMGHGGFRWDDIYATNGTIQTSDFNEKQDIASLTATEMLVGKRISALFKTFRWKDAVVEKGDNARTHTGVIAQDVQAAFTAEGLDAGDYALFTSFTWWEQEVEVPAVEAVAEVTDENGNVTTEAIEAVDAYTDIEKYDTEDEAPEGATSKTRLGIRYPELLSFVAAYNEQRFASIEARLTALEA